MKKTAQLIKNNMPSKMKQTQPAIVLSDEISLAIASKIIPTMPAPEVSTRIKSKLMQRVQTDQHQFVFDNQGEWKTLSAGVQIKMLHSAGKRKSFLLKMAANSSIPKHLHAHDEESFVVEGTVIIEGILCHTGDYHYAHAGSQHQAIQTADGCTLLVRRV